MLLTLDVQQLRAAMDLWRHALAMRDASGPDERGKALSDLSATIAGWQAMLHACTAIGSQVGELEQLRLEVREFKDWAAEAREALRILADRP